MFLKRRLDEIERARGSIQGCEPRWHRATTGDHTVRAFLAQELRSSLSCVSGAGPQRGTCSAPQRSTQRTSRAATAGRSRFSSPRNVTFVRGRQFLAGVWRRAASDPLHVVVVGPVVRTTLEHRELRGLVLERDGSRCRKVPFPPPIYVDFSRARPNDSAAEVRGSVSRMAEGSRRSSSMRSSVRGRRAAGERSAVPRLWLPARGVFHIPTKPQGRRRIAENRRDSNGGTRTEQHTGATSSFIPESRGGRFGGL